ncbi:glutaminyl-tRNA synthase (glutamine-hydrolyzing) subunit B [Armatimonadetes bacterium Uphvl-Ar1]|nr:glutaminyl-tRNA synthase (glutamine-hydrolyzing) subunit B [Armatimonadetes bacterium Uphvl-Ar1]
MPEYVVSVGMEVHAELMTESKMFCRCPVGFGGMPNTRTCPICLGLPGTLPVPNEAAVEMVIKTALALNCTVPTDSVFHRKNYYYPDLPKGFQVSQYGETNPIGYNGFLEIPAADGGTKRIKIRRVHLEEDTGKLMHLPGGGSGVDYNRAGVPLMEIVTDFPPDIESPDEAKEYMSQLRAILIYLGVCDGKLEQGSMRCEPNISVRLKGSETYGTKTELKNLNSFKSVQLGIEYELKRQSEVLEAGGTITQETRGWNEQTLSSYLMRVKESEADYRYFVCPDLIPMNFSEEKIEAIRATLPELPLAKLLRFENDFGLSNYDAGVLVSEQYWADYFEKCVELGADPKQACNWMNGDFARMLNEAGQVGLVDGEGIEDKPASQIRPQHLVELIGMIESGAITGKIAKSVFETCFATGKLPSTVVEEEGLTVISDTSAIDALVAEVIAGNPGQVLQYREGKESLIGFFVGQVMRKSEGRADPQSVQAALRDALK